MKIAEKIEFADLTDIGDLSGSLGQRVYHSLREAILSLRLPPGTVLRKSAIGEELGVSRQPVSEAIARLAADGLVDVVPQSGTRVSRFSMDEIREAAFMRAALEIAAVGKVAMERTAEQLAQLTRNVRLQQLLAEDRDQAGFYEADEEFHALLMEFTGFPGLAANVGAISLKLKRPRILLLPGGGCPARTTNEHMAILDGIRDRDPDAAREAMRFHLEQSSDRFLSLEVTHPHYFRSR
jgi:DNA-binding GntR family transcriptional regulator